MKNYDITRQALREAGWVRDDETRNGIHLEQWWAPGRLYPVSYEAACKSAKILDVSASPPLKDPRKPYRRNKKFQAKHLDTAKILEFVRDVKMPETDWTCIWHIQEQLFPEIPPKVVTAKMKALVRNKLVDGCVCGCRGDFELLKAGYRFLRKQAPLGCYAAPSRSKTF
jgi:hypothetical protein